MGPYSIIFVNSNNIDEYQDCILQLWRENLRNGSIERFNWLYKMNPVGSVLTWLARDDSSGAIVGCSSVYPREVIINGKNFIFGVAIDFAVNRNYRVFGPALQIQKKIISCSKNCNLDFLLAWPNASSSGLFLRAGYSKLSEVYTFVKLLRSVKKIKKYFNFFIVTKSLSNIIDFYFTIKDNIIRLVKPHNLQSYNITKSERELDTLWELFCKQKLCSANKKSSFLQWRYIHAMSDRYTKFCLVDLLDHSIKGCLIYSINGKSAIIWDIFCLSDSYYRYLVTDFSFYLRKRSIHDISLSMVANSLFKKLLLDLDFFMKKADRPCFIFSHNSELLVELRDAIKESKLGLMDGDLDL